MVTMRAQPSRGPSLAWLVRVTRQDGSHFTHIARSVCDGRDTATAMPVRHGYIWIPCWFTPGRGW